jgi:tetratricopeptide (TPR) repeat protein
MIKAIRDLFQPNLQAFAIDNAEALSQAPVVDFVERFRRAKADGKLRPVTLRPTNIKAEHRQIMGLIREGQLNQARCMAEDMARQADLTEDHHALYLLALTFLNRGETAVAETCLRRSLWRVGDHVGARTELGLICLRTARAKEAAHHLKRARDAGSKDPRVLQILARALEADNRPVEALAAYDEALTLSPDNAALAARRAALARQTA